MRAYSQNSEVVKREAEEQVSTVRKMNELSEVRETKNAILNIKMNNVPRKESRQK